MTTKCPACLCENAADSDLCHGCGKALRQTPAAINPAPKLTATQAGTAIPADTLKLKCACGAKFRVKSESAGRKVRCPKCQLVQVAEPSNTVGKVSEADASDSKNEFAVLSTSDTSVPSNPPTQTAQSPEPTPLPTAASGAVESIIEGSDADLARNAKLLADAVEFAARRKPMQSESIAAGQISARKFKQLLKAIEEHDGYSDPETAKRRAAIVELGQSRDPQVLEQLQAATKDFKTVVRDAAVSGLGEVGSPDGVPALLQALLDSEVEVRRSSVNSLRRIADMRAIRPLMSLALAEPRMRHLALDVVVKWGALAVPELLSTLKERDSGLAINSVIALGRIRDPLAVPGLLASLNFFQSPLQRNYVIEALGLIDDKRVVAVLIDALKDPTGCIRLSAAAALLKIKDPRAVSPLMEALLDEQADVRRMAAVALGEVGDSRAVPVLTRLLGNWQELVKTDAPFVAAVIEALGKLGDVNSARDLIPVLESTSEVVLEKALFALKRLKSPESFGAMTPLLRDPRSALRRIAVEILGLSGEETAVTQLVKALRDDASSEVRAVAARVLGERKLTAVRADLEDALHDEAAVRIHSVIALGKLLDRRSIPALLAMFKDAASEVRFHAVQAIGKYGEPKTLKAVSVLLNDDDPLVREAAIKSLEKLSEAGAESAEKLIRQARLRDRLLGLIPNCIRDMSQRSSIAGAIIAASLACILVGGFFLRSSTGTPPTVAIRGQVAGLVFSADGRTVAATRTEGLLECWDVEEKRLRCSLPGGYSGVLNGDGRSALMLVRQKLFSWQVGELFQPDPEKPLASCTAKLVVTNPEGKWAASVGPTGEVGIWDLQSLQLKSEMNVGNGNVLGFAISPDGTMVAGSSSQGIITLFDVESGKTMQKLQSKPAVSLTQVAISADKQTVVASGDSGKIYLWNVASPDVEKILDAEPLAVKDPGATVAIQFFPDSLRFAVGSSGSIKVLRVDSDEVKVYSVSLNQVGSMALDSSGKLIAVGGPDNWEFMILDADSGELISELDLK